MESSSALTPKSQALDCATPHFRDIQSSEPQDVRTGDDEVVEHPHVDEPIACHQLSLTCEPDIGIGGYGHSR